MFAETSSLQKAFATFADVPISVLDSNADYRKQVNLVADRLDNMISTLDNTLQIMGQFKYMGHSHAPRGIDRREFEVTTECKFVDVSSSNNSISRADLQSYFP